jgi:membrane dipeptidase
LNRAGELRMNRRELFKRSVVGGGAMLLSPMINRRRYQLFANSATEYSARAIKLVQQSLVIDMLSPLSVDPANTWQSDPNSFTSTDLQRFKDSGIKVFNLGGGGGGSDAYLRNLRFMAEWNGFIAHHDRDMMRIDSLAALDRAKESGKIGILIGVQNAEHFQSLNDIQYFFALGLRVAQLTYNRRNLIGNGATERRDEGLSDYGLAVVERMNTVGLAIDVSHCGDRTTLDAFEASKKPVLITHSNCRALVPGHPRLKTDEAIRKMAATGGVMGITGLRMFVRAQEPTTIEHVLDHFDHVAKLVGIEHVGIGSDSDLYGYDRLPPAVLAQMRAGFKSTYAAREKIDIEGLNHPQRVFDLTEGLIRRKYSDADIQLTLGLNFRRVLSQIWPS